MYFICICCFSSVSILFQNYPFTTEPFSESTLCRRPPMFCWRGSGEPFINFQISADFSEMKRLCTFLMPFFLYDWDFIFLFVLTLKFEARHRWKVILWFNGIQIAHFVNVSLNNGSGQTEAGRRFFAMPHPYLTLVSMETGRRLISHNLWAEELLGPWRSNADSTFVSVCLSASVVPFPRSATVWLLLYCHPTNTPKSCSGLL